MFLLVFSSSNCTKGIKASIESSLRPLPLFLAECLMVWHIFLGRLQVCIACGLLCGKILGRMGSEHNDLTMFMLFSPMVAIVLSEHIWDLAVL